MGSGESYLRRRVRVEAEHDAVARKTVPNLGLPLCGTLGPTIRSHIGFHMLFPIGFHIEYFMRYSIISAALSFIR